MTRWWTEPTSPWWVGVGGTERPLPNSEIKRDGKMRSEAFNTERFQLKLCQVFFTHVKSEVIGGHQSRILGLYTLHDKVLIISAAILAGKKTFENNLWVLKRSSAKVSSDLTSGQRLMLHCMVKNAPNLFRGVFTFYYLLT